MKREPTDAEKEKINEAIFAGDRVEATNIYITITGCGLTEVQNHIKALTEKLKATDPDKFVRREKRRKF